MYHCQMFYNKSENKMTLDEAVTYYNHNYSRLARALGITKQTLSLWKQAGREIPYHYQCQIEVMTDRALKANRKDA
jgi:hypothetical protein